MSSTCVDALVGRGVANFKSNKLQQAIDDLAAAQVLDPNHKNAAQYLAKAKAAAETKRRKEAHEVGGERRDPPRSVLGCPQGG